MQIDRATRQTFSDRDAPAALARSGTRPTRAVLGLALTVVMASVLAASGHPAIADTEGAERGRYAVLRARDVLVRADTATGQVWVVPVTGDGGWISLGPAPEPAGEAQTPGRYRLTVLSAGKRRMGDTSAIGPPRLLRTDRATGRAWLGDTDPDEPWSLIGDAASARPGS